MAADDRSQRIASYVAGDRFVASLGIERELLEEGHARFAVTVREDQLNFHGTTHGGLLFTLADAALAAASNSRGQTAFALQVSLSFLKATTAGTRLVAEAREVHAAGPTALYELEVRESPSNELVARAQATTYRKRDGFV
jgi:acyl-CoA thioesterase